MTCDLREFVQRQVYFLGVFEPVESYLFIHLLEPGMVVIDAGANIGQYTILAATAVGSAGRVHSFEPIPANFARLQEHVARNGLGNVSLNRAAVWNEDTRVTLGLPSAGGDNAGNWVVGPSESRAEPVTADAVRLDTYVREQGIDRVDVIKMDIQGAEPAALAGAHELISRWHPTLLMEVHRPSLRAAGSSPEMLWDELSKHGYRAWRIRPSRKNSGPVANLDGVEFENFFFHCADLPAAITGEWPRRLPKQWACSGW